MLATRFSNLTATTGKAVSWRFVRTVSPVLDLDLVVAVDLEAGSELVEDSVVAVASEAVEGMVEAVEALEDVEDMAVGMVEVQAVSIPADRPTHRTHSLTLLAPTVNEVRQSLSKM
jgi:hypothetical protein